MDDDEDGTVDEGFVDTDLDGVLDIVDNCPMTPNPDQTDAASDAVGDACQNGAPVFELSIASGGVRIVATPQYAESRGVNVYRRVGLSYVHLGGTYPSIGTRDADPLIDLGTGAASEVAYVFREVDSHGYEGIPVFSDSVTLPMDADRCDQKGAVDLTATHLSVRESASQLFISGDISFSGYAHLNPADYGFVLEFVDPQSGRRYELDLASNDRQAAGQWVAEGQRMWRYVSSLSCGHTEAVFSELAPGHYAIEFDVRASDGCGIRREVTEVRALGVTARVWWGEGVDDDCATSTWPLHHCTPRGRGHANGRPSVLTCREL